MLQENFIRIYEASFRENWERPALTDYFKKETFTYGEMSREIAQLHLLFKVCKIKKGDRIALIGRNNPRWCISMLATMTYGAVVVPILQDFNANDIQHIINHSGSVLLFCGDQYWDLIGPDDVPQVRAVFSLTDFGCLYERKGESVRKFLKEKKQIFRKKYPRRFAPKDIHFAEVDHDDMILLNYTSGTTGFTKGVMLTVNNLTGNIVFGLNEKIHYPGSRALAILPLAHAYGCMFDFLYPLACGTHITLLGKMPSPKILLEALAEVKPYLVICVPLILEKIYKKQIVPVLEKAGIRFALNIPLIESTIYARIRKKLIAAFGGEFFEVIVGGAPLNEEVEAFLLRIKFPFTVGYGMTECGPLISYAQYDTFVAGSCGRALPGLMDVMIESEDPVNVEGEICVRGENVMKGYYKNEEATADAFMEGGWFRTGDRGTIDAGGNIHIRGRSKSMILGANGQNIYPEEIEAKLNNLPCVLESVVVSRDGRLVALVYPDYEQTDCMKGCGPTQLAKIMEANKTELNKLVAPYERIAEIILHPHEFEKTPKKSIKRYLYH